MGSSDLNVQTAPERKKDMFKNCRQYVPKKKRLFYGYTMNHFAKPVKSRWLNVGFLFLRFYGPRRNRGVQEHRKTTFTNIQPS